MDNDLRTELLIRAGHTMGLQSKEYDDLRAKYEQLNAAYNALTNQFYNEETRTALKVEKLTKERDEYLDQLVASRDQYIRLGREYIDMTQIVQQFIDSLIPGEFDRDKLYKLHDDFLKAQGKDG